MRYSPDLASAELEQMSVMVEHHLRHIETANDVRTAQLFSDILNRLAQSANRTLTDCRRAEHAKKCDRCADLQAKNAALFGFATLAKLHAAHRQLEFKAKEIGESITFEVIEARLFSKMI